MHTLKRIGNVFITVRNRGIWPLLAILLGYDNPRSGASSLNESRIAFRVFDTQQNSGIMVDVGAHFGGALGPFARAGWRVLGFEPDSRNRRKLIDAFGDVPNVTIDCRGLSSTSYSGATWYSSEVSTGISGLSAFHTSHTASATIDVTTLERICHEYHLTHIDFLKIDTEGFDLFVLNGLSWNEISPRFILCEFEDAKTTPLGYTFHDLATSLTKRGYKLLVSEWYPIEQYGGPHQWRCFSPYPCALHDSDAWGNIFAVKEEHLYRALLHECKQVTEN